MRLKTTCFIIFLSIGYANAQDTLRVMTYNILNYSGTGGVITRYQDLKVIIDYTLPDIFICSELIDDAGATLLLNNSFNASGRTYYQRANFADGPDTDNMLYYNSNKVHLNSQVQISTVLRDISHYRLYYTNGADTAWISIFSAHLKASNTAADQNQRLQEATSLCNYLAGFPSNETVIVGGDFNFYTSAEPAWNLLTSNSCGVRFYDPVNQVGTWNSNSSYSSIHTQSTRSNSNPGCCGGSTGGLDDRFDFLLANYSLINGTDYMQIIPGTYKAFGNDGNHFNLSLVEGSANAAVPSSVNTALFNMSDHLPVMMDMLVQWDLKAENLSRENYFRVHFTGTDNTGVSHFYLYSKNSGEYHFEIMDSFGRMIGEQTDFFAGGEHQVLFGKDFPSGVYFLRVKMNDDIRILKFVK